MIRPNGRQRMLERSPKCLNHLWLVSFREQVGEVESASKVIQSLEHVVKQNAALSEKVSSTIENLFTQVADLQKTISNFIK